MDLPNLFISILSGILLGIIYAFLFTKKIMQFASSSKETNTSLMVVVQSIMNILVRYVFLAIAFVSLVHFLHINLLVSATVFIVAFWIVLLKRMKRHES